MNMQVMTFGVSKDTPMLERVSERELLAEIPTQSLNRRRPCVPT